MEKHFYNPMSKSIHIIFKNIKGIKIEKMVDVIPAIIMLIIYLFVFVICLIFWAYGFVSVVEQIFRYLIKTMTKSAKESESSYIESVPIYISIGLCCIMWLPFGILVLPLLVIGYFVSIFFRKDEQSIEP